MRKHIIPISGKDSLATAILMKSLKPELDFIYIFNPTNAELPDVFKWLGNVSDYLGKKIHYVGKDLNRIIENNNYYLPSPRARYCTRQSKIEPFVNYLSGEECQVYFGIRADEERQGFNNTLSPNITPVYPLVEYGIDLKGVLSIINKAGLKPPQFFWNRLYNAVLERLCVSNLEFIPEFEFDQLFAGRSRANCYYCFNQRIYEYVWLLETYPELYQNAELMEYKGGESVKIDSNNNIVSTYGFTWKTGYSFKNIRLKKDYYFNKHVNKTCSIIAKKYLQKSLFEDIETEYFLDILSVKSCGLLCGK